MRIYVDVDDTDIKALVKEKIAEAIADLTNDQIKRAVTEILDKKYDRLNKSNIDSLVKDIVVTEVRSVLSRNMIVEIANQQIRDTIKDRI